MRRRGGFSYNADIQVPNNSLLLSSCLVIWSSLGITIFVLVVLTLNSETLSDSQRTMSLVKTLVLDETPIVTETLLIVKGLLIGFKESNVTEMLALTLQSFNPE